MTKRTVTIGGASGFWGDAALATPQLLATQKLDYLVYDYLAEITMSIMARARASDPSKGYAVDFVSQVLRHNLVDIHRQGVKVIANAGGVNVDACAEAVRELAAAAGLSLKVATVSGDDLLANASQLANSDCREMFSGEPFPPEQSIASINAYLGAFPIAKALDEGADIVITGRCVDSAVTLGACIHAFDWQRDALDKLAQGSLAGHILECGTQATGGNFTDWEALTDSLVDAGYPMATVDEDGDVLIHKPDGSGGLVSVGTVAEQMLYEIGDPQAYILPDVVCDFSQVKLEQVGDNCVRVQGAKGRGVPDSYKVSATYADGFRAGQVWSMIGRNAQAKAEYLADGVFTRARRMLKLLGMADFTETSCEVVGVESQFGASRRRMDDVREVDVKLAVKHPDARGVGIFLKEMVGMALTAPPGLTGFSGARPKPSPVVRLFSTLVAKNALNITVNCDGNKISCDDQMPLLKVTHSSAPQPPVTPIDDDCVPVALESLAFGRSGDKGDKANIGIIARHADFVPFIADQLSVERITRRFAHFLAPDQDEPVERFYMPGTGAFNFLLHRVLGGGGIASLRLDPQGKAYAQIALAEPVLVPRALAMQHGLTLLEDSTP